MNGAGRARISPARRAEFLDDDAGDVGQVQPLGLVQVDPGDLVQLAAVGQPLQAEQGLGRGHEEAGVEPLGPVGRGDRPGDEVERGEVGLGALGQELAPGPGPGTRRRRRASSRPASSKVSRTAVRARARQRAWGAVFSSRPGTPAAGRWRRGRGSRCGRCARRGTPTCRA